MIEREYLLGDIKDAIKIIAFRLILPLLVVIASVVLLIRPWEWKSPSSITHEIRDINQLRESVGLFDSLYPISCEVAFTETDMGVSFMPIPGGTPFELSGQITVSAKTAKMLESFGDWHVWKSDESRQSSDKLESLLAENDPAIKYWSGDIWVQRNEFSVVYFEVEGEKLTSSSAAPRPR